MAVEAGSQLSSRSLTRETCLRAVESPTKKVIFLVAAATAVALLLRFPYLGNQSFWFDEMYTLGIASAGSLSEMWRGVVDIESTPPLFYLLTWIWTNLVGSDSEAALRTVSAVAGVLTVPAAFFALRRLCGNSIAAATAWLCATSPMLVFYSLDARSYSLFVLMSLLSIWSLGLLLEESTRKRWVLLAVANAAMLWTHYFAVYLILAELLVINWLRPMLRRKLIAWSGLTALLVLPLVPMFMAQVGDERAGWIGMRSLTDKVEQFVRQFALGPNVPSGGLEAAGLALAVVAFAWGLLIARRRDEGEKVVVALIAVAVLVPLVVDLVGIDNHFLDRTLLMVWPLFAAVAALALTKYRSIPLLLYLALSIGVVVAIQADWRYQNTDWRGAARALRAAEADQPFIVYPGTHASVAAHYFNGVAKVKPVTTTGVWVVVEPKRSDKRELESAGEVQIGAALGPGFELKGQFTVRGFRLLNYQARRSEELDPAKLQTALVEGSPPVLLVP